MRLSFKMTWKRIVLVCLLVFSSVAVSEATQDTVQNHPTTETIQTSDANARWLVQRSEALNHPELLLGEQEDGLKVEFKFAPEASLTSANPLGVYVSRVSPEFAGHLGINQPAVVLEVPESCPGFVGGLRNFDIVLQLSDQKPESPTAFDSLVTAHAGKTINLLLLRRAEQIELDLSVPGITPTLNAFYLAAPQHQAAQEQSQTSAYKLGVVLAEVDDVLRVHLNLASNQGILVTDITPDGAAAKIGCEANDIFLELDGRPIESQEQLRGHVQEIGDREVLLKLLRRGKTIEVKITPKLVADESTGSHLGFEVDLVEKADQIFYLQPRITLLDAVRSPFEHKYLTLVPHLSTGSSDDSPANQLHQLKGNVAELQGKLAEILSSMEKLEKSLEDPKSKSP